MRLPSKDLILKAQCLQHLESKQHRQWALHCPVDDAEDALAGGSEKVSAGLCGGHGESDGELLLGGGEGKMGEGTGRGSSTDMRFLCVCDLAGTGSRSPIAEAVALLGVRG